MAHLFDYDNQKHRHTFYAVPTDEDCIEFKPVVHRWAGTGIQEVISNSYPELSEQRFSTQDACIKFAKEFFYGLPH
jgi:hypothetical protein